MAALKALMRLYSYLFHGVLASIMVAMAVVSWFSGAHALDLILVPWRDEALRWTLFLGGLAGLVVVWLASRDKYPALFVAWSGLIFLVLLRGFFFGWVHYVRGPYSLDWALLLTAASLLALAGAWLRYRSLRTAAA
ncbi:MAG: hypothetical protein RMI94_10355 [Bryobacterales bacterium]|nr:hypothetical protein [Bryobacterales bacterium]